MKRILSCCLLLFVSVSVFAQQFTAADWQSDLRFLQQTVHKDYSHLFKKVTAEEFDKTANQLYNDIPKLSENEIMAGFSKLVAMFGYGHTSIYWHMSPIKYHILPLNLYRFSDGVYIEGCDKKYEDVVGAKVISVEGMPVDKALEAVKPIFPAENDFFFMAYGLDYLTIPETLEAQKVIRQVKPTMTYTLEKNGKKFDKSFEIVEAFRLPRSYSFSVTKDNWVSARNQKTTPYYLKDLDKIYYYEYLPESKTVYVRHSQIQDDPSEAIPAFYKKVFDFINKNDVEKMVLDVRLNGGGNNYKNKPIITGIIETAKINQPGKLFVIIGRRTYSACQNLVNELSNYTNAMFVGEPTGENINFYGDNRLVELPKTKIPVRLSFAWWQDKPQWENADWTAPQYAVDMSFEQYKNDQDPVLDACLGFKEKDVLLDPFAHLRNLYMQGKVDEVEKAAIQMSKDPHYRYMNFETQINKAGYDMLNAKMMKEALYIFGLNTRLYPNSANVWDSYAEVHMLSGDNQKAIEYYKKALAMDPNGNTGANARSMLRRLTGEGATKPSPTSHNN
ncbi:MAG: tetratricopeptide repeat protein [Chitinophagales bacterium]|nr:tetratricopeptide repeat protein [Chitinophagales bacterium]